MQSQAAFTPETFGTYEPALQRLSLTQQAQLYGALHMHLCSLHGMAYPVWPGQMPYLSPYAYSTPSMWHSAPGPMMPAAMPHAPAAPSSSAQGVAIKPEPALKLSSFDVACNPSPAMAPATAPLQQPVGKDNLFDSIFDDADIDFMQDSGEFSMASEGTHDTAQQNNQLQQQPSILGPVLLDGVVPAVDELLDGCSSADAAVVPQLARQESGNKRHMAGVRKCGNNALGLSPRNAGVTKVSAPRKDVAPQFDALAAFLDEQLESNFDAIDNLDFELPLLA